jgi:hypothetical protein
MRRIIALGGKCDSCGEGHISLRVAPLYVSLRFWGCMSVAAMLGFCVGGH